MIRPEQHWCEAADLDFACVGNGEVHCRGCGREWRRVWSKPYGTWRWRVSVAEHGSWATYGDGFVNRRTGEVVTIHHLVGGRGNDYRHRTCEGPGATNTEPFSEARP